MAKCEELTLYGGQRSEADNPPAPTEIFRASFTTWNLQNSSSGLAHSILAFPLFSLSALSSSALAASWEMRLFLVRHGETVDNVAGLYAGIRDSPLTAHGVLQARRLGEYLAKQHRITHVFSSDLQRAIETAVKVVDAQPLRTTNQDDDDDGDEPDASKKLKPLQLVDLRERDFRSAEGKKFGAPLGDAETHEEMRLRAARFVQRHLVPLLESGDSKAVVVVVAHGLILNSLFRVLQARFGAQPRGSETPATWSNTGYLEAVVKAAADKEGLTAEASGDRKTRQPQFSLSVVGLNVLRHLEGLKKTRGGIGSAQFDKRQRTMDSFFGPASKKPRVDPESERS